MDFHQVLTVFLNLHEVYVLMLDALILEVLVTHARGLPDN
jgi:hypothetical protein